jgi:hypothetical protein
MNVIIIALSHIPEATTDRNSVEFIPYVSTEIQDWSCGSSVEHLL